MDRHVRSSRPLWIAAAVVLCIRPALGAGEKGPPGPAGGAPVVWSPYAVWQGRQVNLGPTGARGWIDGHRIYVHHVAAGSPADGILRKGDVLIGAGGRPFAEADDPRMALGAAVTAAETEDAGGKLSLVVERDGRERTVRVRLDVMGSYSPTWPFDCAKSRKVLEQACAHLAAAQYPDGHFQGELGMATAWDGLLLLASGDPRYLDNARRAAYWLTEQSYAGVVLNSWPCGYSGLFLAEYYLATGDREVLPNLAELAGLIADGQMACGSWGHSIPWGGYGAVNQVGLSCLIALVLARECGVEVDDAAIQRSATFFLKYAQRGWVPYGDHRPWLGNSGNGKNALAAVAFALLGKEPRAVRNFSTSVAASYRYREEGHTGCFFSLFWGPLAAVHADGRRFRAFLDYQTWYYDLARTHDGGLVCQPNAENLSGRTAGTYTWSGPEYTTGGMALFYALPRKTLRILGAGRSVFSPRPPARLARARTLYQQRNWDELKTCLDALTARTDLSAEERRLADQLAAAAAREQRSVALVLRAIESNVREGDVYRASELLKSLQRRLGKDAAPLAAAKELVGSNEQWIETGREYYQAWSALRDFTWQYWHYYGQRATAALEGVAPPVPRRWEALAETSEDAPRQWRALQWGDLEADDPHPDPAWGKLAGWSGRGFDDSAWAAMQGPVKPARPGAKGWNARHILLRRTFNVPEARFAGLRVQLSAGRDCLTEVCLNGTQVLRAVQGPNRGYVAIELPGAAALLRKGENLLAVHCRRGPRGGPLDVGLEGASE